MEFSSEILLFNEIFLQGQKKEKSYMETQERSVQGQENVIHVSELIQSHD